MDYNRPKLRGQNEKTTEPLSRCSTCPHRRAGMKCVGAIAGLVLALATHVEAAEIKVISTGGARAVMTSLVPEFERKSGQKVSIDFGTPGNMRDRLLQGEAADVAIAIAAILPDLEKAGKIASGTRMEFAASYVGVAVRAGSPTLDVSTPDGVKRAMLMAKTVALSDPKAGTQLGGTFIGVAARLGFGVDLRSRSNQCPCPVPCVAEADASEPAYHCVNMHT